MNTFDEYQESTNKTAIYPREDGVNYCILGLVGEAGELANKYKKVLRDDNGILTEEKRLQLISELGDVFWYCSQLSIELGVQMKEIAAQNVKKLLDRRERNVVSGSGDNR